MVSQADLITDLLLWYEENREAIAAALPLSHQGTTRTRLEPLDEAIRQYQAGELNKRMAYCYVRRPLERLKTAFELSKKED